MEEPKTEKSPIEQKWAKETEERKPAIIHFLSKYFNEPIEERIDRYKWTHRTAFFRCQHGSDG